MRLLRSVDLFLCAARGKSLLEMAIAPKLCKEQYRVTRFGVRRKFAGLSTNLSTDVLKS
jgi:hypothetical protein